MVDLNEIIQEKQRHITNKSVSMRDSIALKAMETLLKNGILVSDHQKLAMKAYSIADAMLSQREL